MNNMRRGFTMIELIFVIVIIGILAAVAIPKLAATRADATSAGCVHEVGQLLSEVSAAYTQNGYTSFKDLKVSKITNITTGVTSGNGIQTDDTLSNGIDYVCDGVIVANFKGSPNGTDYNLTVTTTAVGNTDTPASSKAKDVIKVKTLSNSLTKEYTL